MCVQLHPLQHCKIQRPQSGLLGDRGEQQGVQIFVFPMYSLKREQVILCFPFSLSLCVLHICVCVYVCVLQM